MDTSDIVNQHDYGIINIYDPDSEGFYLVQFISISFTLQDTIYIKGDIINEWSLVCDAKYTIPEQECSRWYIDT